MPAKSIAQQKMFGMALAYKRGELKNASDEVKKLADSMSEKELTDFAKTKHDGLPDKVKNESFNDYIEQILFEARDGEIDKFIKLKISSDVKITQDWSGWYLPKENALIYFEYAGHVMFMYNFWPALPIIPRPGKQEKGINMTDPGLKKITKKYTKDVVKNYDKEQRRAEYKDFYNLGWIRVNLHHGQMNVTFEEENKHALKNLLLWVTDNLSNVKSIDIVNEKTHTSTHLNKDEIKNFRSRSSDEISGGDIIDKVRTQMFGPGFYVDDITTFEDFVKFLLNEK